MIEGIDVKTIMRNDLEAAGIDADRYLQVFEIIETLPSHTGLYLLQSGKRLNFGLAFSPLGFGSNDKKDYFLSAKASFNPVGVGWREIEIWEGNLSRAKSGGPNMPQISISTRFSPGTRLDQIGIVISQDTNEDLDVYFEVKVEALQS